MSLGLDCELALTFSTINLTTLRLIYGFWMDGVEMWLLEKCVNESL